MWWECHKRQRLVAICNSLHPFRIAHNAVYCVLSTKVDRAIPCSTLTINGVLPTLTIATNRWSRSLPIGASSFFAYAPAPHRFGETPKPTRETRALPGIAISDLPSTIFNLRFSLGGIAQLVERQLCKLEVRGSNPLASISKQMEASGDENRSSTGGAR